ncbi:MAG: hypothetical protein KDJ16_17755 [Hyphomicrobiales bacterium]|nr:hypothetical protein [Hyphomicrobiales bacterium]
MLIAIIAAIDTTMIAAVSAIAAKNCWEIDNRVQSMGNPYCRIMEARWRLSLAIIVDEWQLGMPATAPAAPEGITD